MNMTTRIWLNDSSNGQADRLTLEDWLEKTPNLAGPCKRCGHMRLLMFHTHTHRYIYIHVVIHIYIVFSTLPVAAAPLRCLTFGQKWRTHDVLPHLCIFCWSCWFCFNTKVSVSSLTWSLPWDRAGCAQPRIARKAFLMTEMTVTQQLTQPVNCLAIIHDPHIAALRLWVQNLP